MEFFLVGAAAAQLEYGISCRMYDFCGDFQQFKTDSVDTLIFHIGGQRKPPEPVEQVVGQRMYLKSVCIHQHRVGTDRSKIKSGLPFLDKVLHLAAAAVKLKDLIRLQIFHGRNYEYLPWS